MKKIAVFPGSFDPITIGHESIVLRALGLFDKIIIAIGENADKKQFFPIDLRMKWLEQVFSDYSAVEIVTYSGLTVDLCKKNDAKYILRGLRTSADFEFERSIGQVNKNLYTAIETIFLLTKAEHTAITSSIVREIFKHGGDITQFIPDKLDISNLDRSIVQE